MSKRTRKTVGSAAIAAALIFSTAGAMPAYAQEEPVPPPTVDTNGDGEPDAWDLNGDGKADAWDTNGDGEPDAFDTDGDGRPDKQGTLRKPAPESRPER